MKNKLNSKKIFPPACHKVTCYVFCAKQSSGVEKPSQHVHTNRQNSLNSFALSKCHHRRLCFSLARSFFLLHNSCFFRVHLLAGFKLFCFRENEDVLPREESFHSLTILEHEEKFPLRSSLLENNLISCFRFVIAFTGLFFGWEKPRRARVKIIKRKIYYCPKIIFE